MSSYLTLNHDDRYNLFLGQTGIERNNLQMIDTMLEKIKDHVILTFFYKENRRCTNLLPYLNILERNKKIILIKLNYETNKDLFEKYNITQVPSIIFKKGDKTCLISSTRYSEIEENLNLFILNTS
jgi:thioredoxin-like negative regulator of GroEL